ncbi:50S ribosomal protein L35 [Candidatus Falkowbacteria bacterium CG_4_10_14_0_2_um_filter_41_15]|uniref:Large ribosomal subunit protein bL35 n=2 Tax=Candidatus Falkowiibacteriota TaxID=1752728 RepID=A0A1J4T6N6_9BACT|nr:MAG: 50S ribosomal protein L35 [Candidatus Falkowbacteria bacterium CG1_02_41_21]PJA09921.1 MAG: 50S ribosomal protein L35 [Candidatus Falkowbacteria bacterium CG_4_10_14_0_2_um_filter_41_15]
MPKIKTHKATSKRFNLTGKGKIKQRKGGQDHFNARNTGDETRSKRRDISTTDTLNKTIKQLIPYN